MKNAHKAIAVSKKALSRYLSQAYQDFEHDEIERQTLGFIECLVHRRGKVSSDIGIYQFAQTILETYDGSGQFLPQSPPLSFQDRLDVLFALVLSLNINPRRRSTADLGAFDILNQISDAITADNLSPDNYDLISRKMVQTIQSLQFQMSELPTVLQVWALDGAIKKTGDLLGSLPANTPEADAARQALQYFWSEYIGAVDLKIRAAFDEKRIEDWSEVIVNTVRFMQSEYNTKCYFNRSCPSEVIIEVFNDFSERLASIKPQMATDAELIIAMGEDQDLGITQHAWKRLSARNRTLIEDGRLKEADNYLSYIISHHLNSGTNLSDAAKEGHARLHAFIDEEMNILYPQTQPKKTRRVAASRVSAELLTSTVLSTIRTDTGLPNTTSPTPLRKDFH